MVSTIIINYLATTGAFGGVTVGEVSSRYQTLFTPAGYAFLIWTLIYISLFGFALYQGRSLFTDAKNKVVSDIGWWFLYSCIANCLWVINWVNDYIFTSVLLMILLLYTLIQIILKTRMELDLVSWKKILFVWWPFSLYAGWITMALITNIAAWLTSIG